MTADATDYRPTRVDGSRTYLYRHFAADGSLLYIGISLSWQMRTKAHSIGSRWFEEVASVTIEQFPTREAALEAEREAIKREKPRFNVIHNRSQVREKAAGKRSSAGESLRDQLGPLAYIAGPHALVGPALVYHENKVSVVVAWGSPGTAGEITELVLGELMPDAPEWADRCSSVMLMIGAGEVTMAMAQEMRADIIRQLRSALKRVEAFDTDIALATAYADQFPSAKSREILHDVAMEVGR